MLATQTPGSHGRLPRTMPVINADTLHFSSASMAGETVERNFSLSSSTSGPRRHHGGRPDPLSGPYPGNDDFCWPTNTGISYASLGTADSPYGAMMSNLTSYDADLTSEFLTEDAFSGSSATDVNLVPSQCLGQDPSQVAFNIGYQPLNSSYNTGMYPTLSPAEYLQQGPPSPPGEDTIQARLAILLSQSGHNSLCSMDDEFPMTEANSMYHAPPNRSDLSI